MAAREKRLSGELSSIIKDSHTYTHIRTRHAGIVLSAASFSSRTHNRYAGRKTEGKKGRANNIHRVMEVDAL